ncbi:tRNA (34-2'-O)-methyltransferase regulator WDR6 [Pelodytes ibericus]
MESVLLVTPITALEFVGDHLVSGEGPYVTVYSPRAKCISSQKTRQEVLQGYTVHGIKLRDLVSPGATDVLLCVFGSKGLIVLQLIINDQEVSLSKTCDLCKLHDWIWDVQWLRYGLQTTSYLGLALGHNSVVLYDYVYGRVLKEVHCSEKCILYSAHFWGTSWEELVLVSGTVFNQLVVWCPSDQANKDGRIEPRRRISGHDGVIFSIFYEERRGVLASASDDRSLRLWDVGELAAPGDAPCLHVLYGHQSRVWSVKLLSSYVISIGEDSACIVWDYEGDLIHTFKGHKGRGIRAVAVKDQAGWVATGGADAGIRIWQITGNTLLSSGPQALDFGSSPHTGTPKAIAMVDTNCLVLMTDMGAIYTYDFSSKEWNFVLEDGNYVSYSLLDVYKSSHGVLCAIGNITGDVKIFSLSSPQSRKDLKLHHGKVHSLTWVPPPSSDTDTWSLFSSGPSGVMVWVEVGCVSGHIRSMTEKYCFVLPPCKQRWHTCMAFLPHTDLLVVGDRRGSLMIFSLNGASELEAGDDETRRSPSMEKGEPLDSITAEGHPSASEANLKRCAGGPVSTLFGIHGKLGVTSVSCHDGFVYSTGRDGLYRQLKVEGDQLILLRKQKACKGMEWIEHLSFTSGGNLLVLGFHSTDFVIWSTRTNEKIHCIPCGGGHRSWGYKAEKNTEVFAYIKSGDIFVYQSHPKENLHNVLKEPMHGREFTCVRYVGTIKDLPQGPHHILITSSEDTTVNVFSFNEVSKQTQQLATLNEHLSSVKSLALADTQPGDDHISTVLFTAGGRAQIECYRVHVTGNVQTARLSCQVVHLASHRLDENWDRMKNKHRSLKMDPETRYMSIVTMAEGVRDSQTPCIFLAAACSDSSVRFFWMCDSPARLVLVAQSFYHQRCVLKVETLVYQSHNGRRRLLCSAATDGRIAFWDISDTIRQARRMLQTELTDCQPLDLQPMDFSISVHQCGINSLHIRETKPGHHWVASGGDDNSIHVCLLNVDRASDGNQETKIQLLKTYSVPSAHSAQVTGLRILSHGLLASVSVDQRLTLWNLGDRGLQRRSTRFCHVADVAELDFWVHGEEEGYLCALCGQGLEIISVSGPMLSDPSSI